MTVAAVSLFMLGWFLIGLSTGLICSWIDCKYNHIHRYDWKAAVTMSFLGLLLFIWMPFFYVRSKNDKKLRW